MEVNIIEIFAGIHGDNSHKRTHNKLVVIGY